LYAQFEEAKAKALEYTSLMHKESNLADSFGAKARALHEKRARGVFDSLNHLQYGVSSWVTFKRKDGTSSLRDSFTFYFTPDFKMLTPEDAKKTRERFYNNGRSQNPDVNEPRRFRGAFLSTKGCNVAMVD
jgi:hypothetical protein